MINMNIDYEAATLHYEPEQIMKHDAWIGDCHVTYNIVKRQQYIYFLDRNRDYV